MRWLEGKYESLLEALTWSINISLVGTLSSNTRATGHCSCLAFRGLLSTYGGEIWALEPTRSNHALHNLCCRPGGGTWNLGGTKDWNGLLKWREPNRYLKLFKLFITSAAVVTASMWQLAFNMSAHVCFCLIVNTIGSKVIDWFETTGTDDQMLVMFQVPERRWPLEI